MNTTEIEECDLRAKFSTLLQKYCMLLTVRIGDHDGFVVNLFSPYYGTVDLVETIKHGERAYYDEVEALIKSMPVVEVERLRALTTSQQKAINELNARIEQLENAPKKEPDGE